MAWWFAVSYPDYFLQLRALVRDPVYRGCTVLVGRGEAVLLIPGFLCGDWMMGTLAGWLTRLGYRAYLSGIDWNIGCPNRTGELLRWRLDQITTQTGSPLLVIGHSLGGLLARFLAATRPAHIRHVMALGSPLHGAPEVPLLASLAWRTLQPFWATGGAASPECGSARRCTCPFAQAACSPLPQGVGCTAVFSKQDEVVDWHACCLSSRARLPSPAREPRPYKSNPFVLTPYPACGRGVPSWLLSCEGSPPAPCFQ